MANNKNYLLNDNFPKHIKNATSTSDGLMSSEDKSKIDQVFEFGLLSPATPDKDGIMTKEDKTKLDAIEDGANNYIHPNDEDTRHVTDSQINKWDTQILYNNNEPTPLPIGGIEKGETFENISYHDLFTKILYPYIDCSLSDIAMTPNTTILEKGSRINLSRIQFKTTTPSLKDTESVHYDFYTNGVKFDSLDSINRLIDYLVNISISADTSITVTVIDNINKKEKSLNLINYKFIYPMYYGVISDSEIIEEALIESKTKLLQNKSTKTLKFTTNNEKMMFAYPKEYGKLSAIYDVNNFNIINTFTVQEVIINANDSSSVPYYVYSNELSSVTDYDIKFIF